MTDPIGDASRLVAALRSGLSEAEEVEVVETHISWVLLVGETAYKIKKPVNFGFVDFSTLDRRRRFCEEEVRLNRRLAPELYRGVVPITGSVEAPIVGGTGEPIEFAVAMRRFPQEVLLDRVLERGELRPEHIDGLAEAIADFHGRVAVAPSVGPLGSPERIWGPVAENFKHIAAGIDDGFVGDLSDRARAMFEVQREELARRKGEGFVRECHGDMHLGNMLLLDGRVVVFDGIEFNDDLRWIDVQSEVAFLTMDLECRSRPGFACRLLNAYLERTGDYAGAALLPFYRAYRAMVRAKVASIRSRQAEIDGDGRQRLEEECRRYLRIADRDSRPGRPVLVITHGPSGSGKTTVTGRIVEEVGAIRLRSDIERKRLFELDPLARDASGRLYNSDATEMTYAKLASSAEQVLWAGFPVAVDATFLSRARRDEFRRLAGRMGVPLLILDVRADETALRERLARRHLEGGDASDAAVAVLECQLAARDPLGDDEAAVPIRSGHPQDLEDAIAAIEQARR